MQDEYILKLKLRDGAFNIAQALASQSSKAAKEKLQEARMEQRELLEVCVCVCVCVCVHASIYEGGESLVSFPMWA